MPKHRSAVPQKMSPKPNGGVQILGTKVSISEELLKETLGSTDRNFINPFLSQLASIGSQGPKVDENGTAFVVSIIKDIKPRDQIEAMLAAQMAAIHNAMMTMTRRLAHVDTLSQQDSAARALNNLARTYSMQMEALKRYRNGGQQKVIVEHVTVNEGGQAIVGHVLKGDRDDG